MSVIAEAFNPVFAGVVPLDMPPASLRDIEDKLNRYLVCGGAGFPWSSVTCGSMGPWTVSSDACYIAKCRCGASTKFTVTLQPVMV